MPEFYPSQLTFARERRGWRKIDLRKQSKISRESISKYECGVQVPTMDTLRAFADALNVPTDFFFHKTMEKVDDASLSFRAYSKLTKAQKLQSVRISEIAAAFAREISVHYRLSAPNIPRIEDVPPEGAAALVRNYWGLGVDPAPNMVHLLEKHGARVFSLPIENKKVDAFSFWHADTPFVFLNRSKTAERGRMDVAHELGHLVMHGGETTSRGVDYEKEANQFAAAFLMPETSVRRLAPYGATLDQMLKLKLYWKVSLQALAYRLHELELISDWRYRDVFIKLGQNNLRNSEPGETIMPETSLLWKKLYQRLREDQKSFKFIATQLNLYLEDINDMLFGIMPTVLEGGGSSSGEIFVEEEPGVVLRAVE